MTKHQAISLKLAQWLGPEVIGRMARKGIFNPFSDSTEGRAQFAECFIKAIVDDIADAMDKAVNENDLEFGRDSDGAVNATLKAIYYAIGGTAGEWE